MHVIWLVFAGLSLLGTLGTMAVIVFADSMSDAPSQDGISVIPALITGRAFTALFFFA